MLVMFACHNGGAGSADSGHLAASVRATGKVPVRDGLISGCQVPSTKAEGALVNAINLANSKP